MNEMERHREGMAGELRAAVDRLLSVRPALLDRVSSRSLAGIAAVKSRYHGDYHLGQVLRVDSDLVITDFEGEPARPMPERRQKHSALRDVAGMLRSFSYVSAVATNNSTAERPGDRHQLGPVVQKWEWQTSSAFLNGYRDTIQGCPVWPSEKGAAERLIEFFVLDKALYEMRYEMDNRPDWLAIPLFGLLRTLDPQRGDQNPAGAVRFTATA
jgi:maltose alpha-D-glucosyltransferase/alpha-amylase